VEALDFSQGTAPSAAALRSDRQKRALALDGTSIPKILRSALLAYGAAIRRWKVSKIRSARLRTLNLLSKFDT
jgi:hypothetical protein